MDFIQQIEEIENRLKELVETGATDETQLNEIENRIAKLKEQHEEENSDKTKSETEIINDSKDLDEASERLLKKYGVSKKDETNKEYTGNIDSDADILLEKITARTFVDTAKGQRAASRRH